ncbi:MAG: dihydropteroate synthase [Oscillospiraceae bacterium]|jgi:dihydropteroate synthase|nr:dihydropteroate synthase [Oscillospiraceae bacterium]
MFLFADLAYPCVMGILNVTPDSFSDGGDYFAPQDAIDRALRVEQEGAAILDIGAQSTRPGSQQLPPEEEIRRLSPVLNALRGRVRIPISVDTFEPMVADEALRLGAQIVNDVSGVVTPAMAEVVRRRQAGWILMHNGGGADAELRYHPDVVTCVHDSLCRMVCQAEAYGVEPACLCIDLGIGFGKTQADNMLLLTSADTLRTKGIALLAGVSRKRLIGNVLEESTRPKERLGGTIAAQTIAQLYGADILRAHDVAQSVQACKFVKSLRLTSASKTCKMDAPELDQMHISGLEFYAFHGVLPEERSLGQRFVLDMILWIDLREACEADDLRRTVNYADVLKTVETVFLQQSCMLIEHAAQSVAAAVLRDYAPVERLRITLHKPNAPVKNHTADIAITINRRRVGVQK